MQELQTEMRNMFQELTQQHLQALPGNTPQTEDQQPEPAPEDDTDTELSWETIMQELSAAPVVADDS
jgi:hypothetical protein